MSLHDSSLFFTFNPLFFYCVVNPCYPLELSLLILFLLRVFPPLALSLVSTEHFWPTVYIVTTTFPPVPLFPSCISLPHLLCLPFNTPRVANPAASCAYIYPFFSAFTLLLPFFHYYLGLIPIAFSFSDLTLIPCNLPLFFYFNFVSFPSLFPPFCSPFYEVCFSTFLRSSLSIIYAFFFKLIQR